MTQTDVMDGGNVPEQFGISASTELNVVSAGVKAGMKEIGTANDMFMVDPTQLKVWPGFNTRVKDERYWEKVKLLAESIKTNGFYKDKPLACYVVKEGDKTEVYVVEGGRRLDAVLMRIAELPEDQRKAYRVPAVPKERETSEVDLVYGLAQGNHSEPFRPYELAVLVKRLKTVYGQAEPEILERLQGIVSSTYLTNLLIVSGAPKVIAEMVLNEELSVTQAAKMMNQYGSKVLEVIEAAKKNADGKKVTDRHLPGKKLEKAVKKRSAKLYESARLVAQDPGFKGLSEETQALLNGLLSEITEHDDTAEGAGTDE